MSYYYSYFNPLFTNLGAMYMQYYLFIDPVIAFILFLSISQWVFTRKYKNWKSDGPSKEAKLIAVAVSLALTFGFAMLELTTGFFFGGIAMQGLAGIILMLLLGVFLYEFLLSLFGEQHKGYAVAFAYFFMHATFMAVYSPLYNYMEANFPLLWAVLGIAFFVSFIAVIVGIVRMMTSMFGGGKKSDEHEHAGAHRAEHAAAHAAPPNDDAHEPQVAAPDTSEVQRVLVHFDQAVRNLVQSYQAYEAACHELLQVRAAGIGQASTPAHAHELQSAEAELLARGTHLAQTLETARNASEALSKAERTGDLSPEHTAHLGQLYAAYYEVTARLATTHMQFQHEWNRIGGLQ